MAQLKIGRQGLAQSRPVGACDLLRARSPGPISIPGRSGRPASSRRPSTSWPGAGAPILDAFDEAGVDVCYEIHPGEDLHDGVTFEMFLGSVEQPSARAIIYDPSHFVLQQLDYLAFIDIYHERIKAFHVKDAEFNPDGPAGRLFRLSSPGSTAPGASARSATGRSISPAIFSKLAQYDYDGWAVLEWECCLKHPEDGAREGAPFIADHIIRVTEKAFDDFAGGGVGPDGKIRRMLGFEAERPGP